MDDKKISVVETPPRKVPYVPTSYAGHLNRDTARQPLVPRGFKAAIFEVDNTPKEVMTP